MGVVTQPQRSFYDEVGGHATFAAIVARFYEQVRDDEILLPLYPEDDMDGAEERLTLFLEQYWGGPTTYGDQRGHNSEEDRMLRAGLRKIAEEDFDALRERRGEDQRQWRDKD